ncbi:beta-galactosidase GalB [Pontiella agarivorans]|uniref:Beta-galactosidase GalB n=1 Tax=Pontiella agarivorans TaxID=3038953 RepID=A0ABU5MUQ1_9BACT|nr:beta-galactosidase GalB [Pontiella agarivorans]MDZ8117826.1 beta-galactosidase GalB [Pontiella agarivorans]
MIKNKLILLILGAALSQGYARETIDFNENWQFARFGPMPNGSHQEEPEGLYEINADDSGWRTLNVPHDWGIEGPFRKDLPNRTGKLPWPGIGWYRKTFELPAADENKRVFIEFDGAMSGTTVWVNGGWAGEWPYGYTSFRFDITPHVRPGQKNVVAVRLNNLDDSSRWYPGGGIYRNVRLVKTDPVHVDQWGVFVSTPEVSEKKATIRIETELKGAAPDEVDICHEIRELNSDKVLEKGKGAFCSIRLKKPKLWSLETPNLYQVTTTVFKDKKAVDTVVSTFGIRSIEFTAQGFFLNGKKTRINGVCQHSDLGPLGMAVNRRAMERQLETLKSFGCNAIRTAHNPPDPSWLELCDRMGVLVVVESFDVWRMEKTVNDYAHLFGAWHERDIRAMVRRDRNHPSVIMWSTGNEVREARRMEDVSMVTHLADIVRDEDATRPSTFGCAGAVAATNGFGAVSDVMGINYKPELYGNIRKRFPNLPFYASETTSSISSRGEYFFPVSESQNEGNGGWFQVSDYGLYASRNGYPADTEFKSQDEHPYVMGEFVWTGYDYIGEPTPYNKDKTNLLNYPDPVVRERVKKEMAALGKEIPPRSSYFGIVDLCGFPKDRYYLYQSRWMPEKPMAHILPHWNWAERIGQVTPVHVYTSGDEAELFLNGMSLGRRVKGPYEYRLRWDDVVYAPGELKVVAYKNGKPWAEETVQTTGAAEQLLLDADRGTIAADGQDLAFVTVRVADADGMTVPRTKNRVKYTISGPGEIAAVGNGDPTDLTTFSSKERKVFNGKALVFIRSVKGQSGTIELLAESDGLAAKRISIKAK